MSVLETSKEAYHSDKMKSGKLKDLVRGYAIKHGAFTARMCADVLDIQTGTLSGVIRPMVKSGELIRYEKKSRCWITKNNAFWLKHKDYNNQIPLIK